MDSVFEYDRSKRFLGLLCIRSHDWGGTGKSLRFLANGSCVECQYARWRKRHPTKTHFRTPRLPNGTPLERRFWSKVEKTGTCWLWQGAKTRKGYGNLHVRKGKYRPAHRIAWELECGPIPRGLWVIHKCDVPSCVNPDHLFLGTATDNVRDMWSKQRGNRTDRCRGEQNNKAKLTADQVREIRRLRAEEGLTFYQLADMFGVSRPAIGRIINGKTWRHVQ